MIILVVAKLTFWNDDYNEISFANNNDEDSDYYLDYWEEFVIVFINDCYYCYDINYS